MLVYRVINYNELELVIKGMFSDIGFIRRRNINSNIKVGNTNNYIIGVRYMHFFECFNDLLYKGVSNNLYVCTYDISDDILNKYKGVGRYLYKDSYIYVIEHAIPSDIIKFNNLVSIDKIKDINNNKYLSIYTKKILKKI